jgi:hypothetical protein
MERTKPVPSLGASKQDCLVLTGDFQILRRGGELSEIAPPNGSSLEGARVPSLVKAVTRGTRLV